MQGQDIFRILLVDDDPLDAGFVARAFQDYSENVTLRHAEDLDSALDALRDGHFDIVVLDINLNGSSGLDAIQPIRALAQTKHIPVVMFTSSSSADDIEAAYSRGANAYVEKPLSIQGYREFARKFLGFWAELALIPA